ncbi:MAG: DUF3999 family protein [Verrucomicrobia bacterium]|nr:DUF3999 family protein [Verrucomicrobiota bacterium]
MKAKLCRRPALKILRMNVDDDRRRICPTAGRGQPCPRETKRQGTALNRADTTVRAPNLILLILFISLAGSRSLAAPFSEWQQRQAFDVVTPGLVKLALPAATLDALRPGLDDLRIADPAGNEMAVFIERTAPEVPAVQPVKSIQSTLRPGTTTLLIETGVASAIDALALESPDRDFIKAVRVEGSQDGQNFTLLAEGVPVFRQAGVSELTIRLPAGPRPWLRLTLDDQRSRPVAFTGARALTAKSVDPPKELVPAAIKSREDADGETRLVLDLGAANLTVAALEFDTPEGLFQREVVVRVPEVTGDEIREIEVMRGTIYSINLGASTAARKLTLAVERQVFSGELIVVIRNFDSPPLTLPALRVTRRPVFAMFQARESGTHFLYVGNRQCPAPRYDLAPLAEQLKRTSGAMLVPGVLEPNPRFRPSETLAGLADFGAALDTNPWRFRKSVQIAKPGPQLLELDLEALSRARDDLADLRLVRDGKQVPYLIQRTSITRALTPNAAPSNDPKQPRLSRWKLTLAQPNLPLTRLECRARTPLFQRHIRLWEEVADGRGGKFARELGNADWSRTTDSKELSFIVTLHARPRSDILFLETDNGDNPPLELENFRLFLSVTRLLFKAAEAPALYYGNPSAMMPRYDLSLVAHKLLASDKALAALGTEETLRKEGWAEGGPLTGVRGWIFWGVLVLVVGGLMAVIARLLPKPPATGEGDARGEG